MSHFAPQSAREAGGTAAKGPASAVNLPALIHPEVALAPVSLVAEIGDIATREFRLDRQFLPGISDLTLDAELIRVADHGRTREESRHSVLFGQLLLKGADEGEHSLHVAVKPFDTDEEAAREYAVASYFASGNVANCDTFEPLGLMRTRRGNPAIISKYRHSVRSMDGIFWTDLIREPLIVNKALGKAGMALARLHSAGWVHGDPEAKNMAWDVLKPHGTSFIIDLESAEPISHLNEKNQRERKIKDLEIFIGSLFRLKEEDEILPDDLSNSIKQYFGLVYEGVLDNSKGNQGQVDPMDINRLADSQNVA